MHRPADPGVPPADPSIVADRVEEAVLARISPTPETLRRVADVRRRLVERAERAARERGAPLVRALVAGSAARGTFLTDRLDIDLFLLFPPTLGREALELEGMALAGELLEKAETRYAEHPYLRGSFEGFAVDAVPGYAIDDPSRPLSAVDRTPFHQAYLEARSTPASVGQVRLTKQYLRALGVYGSEARTGGFSGYLVELLVLRFGSLRGLLAEARRWTIPVRLATDPTSRPVVPEDVALVLDDPVDPHRNVATALSRHNLALFILAADAYLAAPSDRAFALRTEAPLPLAEARARIEARGTHVAFLSLPRPSLVDDILFPQLRKAERSLAEGARRAGFEVFGTAGAAGEERLVLLVEVGHRTLPAVRLREGPPAGLDRTAAFLEKWTAPDAGVLQGPYVTAEGHLAVETRREAVTLEEVLAPLLRELPIGKDLRPLVGPDTALRPIAEAPATAEVGRALAELLRKKLPWSADA